MFLKRYIFIKIFIIIFIINIYIFKINNLINYKIGKINLFNINSIVYSKIINIDCKSNISKDDIIKILLLSKYIEKKDINFPGEFSINSNYIMLFKKSFNFYYGYEKETIYKMYFVKNKLTKIIDENNNCFESINIDPKIISIINNNSNYKLFLPIDKFPKKLIKILIEIEDKNFYIHKGIDFYSIIRATIKNLYNVKIIEGGSTITQQLIKNIFLTNKKSFLRKINEILISLIFEYKFSKNKILELYLNEVYFGNLNNKEIRGFPLASIYYFGKYIYELDINEQVILISMLKGASIYNPMKNLKLTNNRKKIILNKIKEKKIINKELYNYLILKNNIFNNISYNVNYPSFINILDKEIKEIKLNYKSNNIKIFSTLDLITQNNVQNSIKKSISYLRKIGNNNIEVSMIVVDRKNGYIKSSVGGFNYNYNGYNRIFINRQIGSLIKPIIYISALDIPNKFNLNTELLDNKLKIKFNNNIWNPKNSDNKFRGNVSLMDSLIYSLNIPTINLGMNIGINNIINNLSKFGINKNINNLPSMLIGSVNLSLIDIAQIYQSISNYGKFIKLSSVRYINNDEKILYFNNKKEKQVISPQASYLTLFCMNKITKIGTAKLLKVFKKINILGKTGTTNELKDNWFVGIDNNEICVIWIGNDNNTPINLNKLNGALYVYKTYLENSNPKSFILNKPKDIYEIDINKSKNILNNESSYEKIPIWINNNSYKHKISNFIYIKNILKKIINLY